MLFGKEWVQEKIVKDAQEYASERNWKVIYGAMVGGISKGLQYADSDYDTRFLYIDKDFPNKIWIPRNEKEDSLKHRYYFDDSVSPYEWIPLWETTSFFQFLLDPAFDGKTSYGLHNVVGWTFNSPYTWDPYGIQTKVSPLVNRLCRPEYIMRYHSSEIDKLIGEDDDRVVIKSYLYAIFSAMAIDWTDKYGTFNPIYMRTMMPLVGNADLQMRVERMIIQSRDISNEFLRNQKEKNKMHDSHCAGMIDRDDVIDDYILRMKCVAEKAENLPKENADFYVNEIYKIIEESLWKEQPVFRVS